MAVVAEHLVRVRIKVRVKVRVRVRGSGRLRLRGGRSSCTPARALTSAS
jgi:hypothetical protein